MTQVYGLSSFWYVNVVLPWLALIASALANFVDSLVAWSAALTVSWFWLTIPFFYWLHLQSELYVVTGLEIMIVSITMVD